MSLKNVNRHLFHIYEVLANDLELHLDPDDFNLFASENTKLYKI